MFFVVKDIICQLEVLRSRAFGDPLFRFVVILFLSVSKEVSFELGLIKGQIFRSFPEKAISPPLRLGSS